MTSNTSDHLHEDAARMGVVLDANKCALKRLANLVSIGVPLAGTLYSCWFFARVPLTWIEISCFLVFYLAIGIGVGIGFHRGFTHQAFVTGRWLKLLLTFLGSMAFQGSVVRWVADHRRHHRMADAEWDTHSPFVYETSKISSVLSGLWHSHVGWMFDRTTTDYKVYAPDLLADNDFVLFHKLYFPICALSLFLPYLYGFVLGGYHAAWNCLLFGGCVRTTVFHNVVWGVNSIGHTFGKQDATVRDGSRNNMVLALATFGEGWHNNHHACPRSAYNQWKWYQIDFNGWLIRLLERSGLVTKVISPKMISPEQQREDATTF